MDIANMFDLKGRVALVTGSSRGIGKAIATALASAGAEVIIHASSESDKLLATTDAINESGGHARSIAANLEDGAEIKKLTDAIKKLDILVMNASVQSYQHIEDFTVEEFDRQYAVNLRSSFQLIQAFVNGMKERGWGRLLAIGSVNQFKPAARLPIYSTTKTAQENLIINCAKQYSQYGITANNLAPGIIQTDRNNKTLADKKFRAEIIKLVPAGFFGNVEDCSGLALLLCSEAGRYITGANIPVTGGMHL